MHMSAAAWAEQRSLTYIMQCKKILTWHQKMYAAVYLDINFHKINLLLTAVSHLSA